MNINYIGNLNRAFDYCKIAGSSSGYEGAMIIYRDRIKEQAFWIPESCIWRYMEPYSYKGDEQAIKADTDDFWNMCRQLAQAKYLASQGISGSKLCLPRSIILERIKKADREIALCGQAMDLAYHEKYYLTTAYNLLKCIQILEIPSSSLRKAAAQLLLWIQSKIPDLKNMPPYEEKSDYIEGHVETKIGDTKISTDIKVTETQLIERG